MEPSQYIFVVMVQDALGLDLYQETLNMAPYIARTLPIALLTLLLMFNIILATLSLLSMLASITYHGMSHVPPASASGV